MSQRGRAASRASNVPQTNLDELQPGNVTKSSMMVGKYVPAQEYQKLFDAAKASLDSFLSTSQQYQQQYESNSRINSRNRQLIEENASLKAKQDQVIEEAKQNAAEKARLKALQVSFDHQIEEKDKQLEAFKVQVAELNAKVLDLTSENSGKGGALSAELKQAQKDLDAKTEELAKTKAALEQAKSEAALALQQEQASKAEAIASAQKERDDAIAAIQKEKAEAIQAAKEELQSQTSALNTKLLSLTSENATKTSELSSQKQQAQKDLDAKSEALRVANEALEQAKSEAALALQQEQASKAEDIAAAQKEKDEAIKAAEEELQSQTSELNARLLTLNSEMFQLKAELDAANGQLESAASLSKENSAMKAKLKQTGKEVQASNAKVQEAERRAEAQKAEDAQKFLELQELLKQERLDAQEKLQAAEAKAEEARTSGIAQLTEAFNKVSGAVKKDQSEIEPSILIKSKSDDFDPNMKIRVVKVPKAMKLTLGGAMASFKDMTDEAVSAELQPGKFKAGSFNIKANNGFATKITLEAGDSIAQVVDTLSQALEGAPLKAGTEKRGDKLFITIRSKEIGEENHFEIYPENQDVLQNIDRQVYPPPKKICIYANSMQIGESGELELQGFDLKKKWHEYMPEIDFSQPQELLINGEKILGQISPQMKIQNKRISSEHALRKIGTLIQRAEKSVEFALKPIRGDDGKVTGLFYLELKSDKPLDIDFPANPMFLGNMVSFDEPETKGCVIVEGKKYEGYDFSIPNLGEIDLLHPDAADWNYSENSPHITYEVTEMGGAEHIE